MGFEINNPFLYQLREGSISDPFVDKVESLKVVDGRLLLTEMPVKQNGVLIDGHTEIYSNTPTGTQFYVDYTTGVVYFIATKNTTVTARYKGRGLVQIPSERIFHRKGSVTRTLDTIVETVDTSSTAANNAASYANQKASEANDAAATVLAQNTISKTNGDYAKTQGEFAKAQGDYAKATGDSVVNQLNANSSAADTARKAALDADNARIGVLNSVSVITNQGTVAGQAAAQATSQADYAKSQGDYAKAQGDAAKAAVVGTITNRAVTSAKLDDDVQVGSLKTLKTDMKSSVTGALNEMFEDFSQSLLGGKMTSTTLANFIGKTTGSTTVNPHIAKRGAPTSLSNPLTNLPSLTEFINVSEYDGISSLNSVSVGSGGSSAINGAIGQHLFSFNLIEQIQRQYGITLSGTIADKVAWLKVNLSKLTFNWYGYGFSAGGNKATIRRWDRIGNSWQDMARTHTAASVSQLTSSGSSNYPQYITDDGLFHALAYAEPSDGVTPSIINTDYVELLVELKTDILSNLPFATATTPGLMSPSDKVKSDNSQLWALTSSVGSGKTPTNNDLNATITAGFYNVQASNLNSNSSSGTLFVSTRGSSGISQIFHTTANKLFTRFSGDTGVTWSIWLEQETTIGSQSKVDSHSADLIKHTSAQERAKWDASQLKKLTEASGYSISSTNADMNTLKDTGFYYGSNMTNGPFTTITGWVLVHAVNSNYLVQEFTINSLPASNTRKFWRVYFNGTWNDWSEVETVAGSQSKVNIHAADAIKHIAPSERSAWNGGQLWKLTADDGTPKQTGVTNADLVVESGEYYTAANCTGMPDNEFYKITSQKINAGASMQYAVKIVSNQLFSRIRSSSIWQPWRKLTDNNTLGNVLLGNKLVDQSNANFVGKVAGSTTASPHIARRTSGTNIATYTILLPPASASLQEFTTAENNQVNSLDASLQTMQIPGGSNAAMAQHQFSFNLIEHIQRTYGTIPGATTADKVAWLKQNISKMAFNWHGYGSSPAGSKATVVMWSNPSNVWYGHLATGLNTVTKLSRTVPTVGDVNAVIDANGFAHFLAYAEASDGTTASVINTDYAELNVELSTDLWSSAKPQWINATLQNSWVEFDATQTPKFTLGKDGFVDMVGAVKEGIIGNTAFTLPTGYRPNKLITTFSTGTTGNIYRILIYPSGAVAFAQSVGAGGNAMVSLDCIRFPTL